MAKGAARENQLGGLHSTLTKVFQRVLEKYEVTYSMLDQLQQEEVSDEMIALLGEITEPNPAMLSAISKFLKDNEIMYDSEELDKLSDQERRLKHMRAKRGNVVSLDNLPVADNG